jgi:hypothetical protein
MFPRYGALLQQVGNTQSMAAMNRRRSLNWMKELCILRSPSGPFVVAHHPVSTTNPDQGIPARK